MEEFMEELFVEIFPFAVIGAFIIAIYGLWLFIGLIIFKKNYLNSVAKDYSIEYLESENKYVPRVNGLPMVNINTNITFFGNIQKTCKIIKCKTYLGALSHIRKKYLKYGY
jgi:hypothetical protein